MVLFDLFFISGGLFTQPRDWLGLFAMSSLIAVQEKVVSRDALVKSARRLVLGFGEPAHARGYHRGDLPRLSADQ